MYVKQRGHHELFSFLGHEITHGFDDKGRLFDCDGNLHRWWSDGAIESFHRRAQCLIDQYGQYIVPEVNMKLDGVNTQVRVQKFLVDTPNASSFNTRRSFISLQTTVKKKYIKTFVHARNNYESFIIVACASRVFRQKR